MPRRGSFTAAIRPSSKTTQAGAASEPNKTPVKIMIDDEPMREILHLAAEHVRQLAPSKLTAASQKGIRSAEHNRDDIVRLCGASNGRDLLEPQGYDSYEHAATAVGFILGSPGDSGCPCNMAMKQAFDRAIAETVGNVERVQNNTKMELKKVIWNAVNQAGVTPRTVDMERADRGQGGLGA